VDHASGLTQETLELFGMPMVIQLEDIHRRPLNRVVDANDTLARVWPPFDDVTFAYIRFIDWYDDTVFNKLQIAPLLQEWVRLYEFVTHEEERRLINEVEQLGRRLESGEGSYLRFIGD
jgi:hypothetical protein